MCRKDTVLVFVVSKCNRMRDDYGYVKGEYQITLEMIKSLFDMWKKGE